MQIYIILPKKKVKKLLILKLPYSFIDNIKIVYISAFNGMEFAAT